MKNIKTVVLFSALALVITGITSCKKDKKDDTTPASSTTGNGTFMFHLHTYIDDTEVDGYNIVYPTTAGRNISLSLAQMYISNIQLVKLDGSTYDFGGKIILKTFEAETYVVGSAPAGNYKSIRFKVGLAAATNALTPAASSDSTILNRPEMWFGPTAQPDGYVFLNLQGKIDTTSDMSGTVAQMQSFSYKIGTNANYKQVNMPDKNYTIIPGQVEYGHIEVSYNKLLNGIQLNQAANLSMNTAIDNSSTLAATLVNNIPGMFSYEE